MKDSLRANNRAASEGSFRISLALSRTFYAALRDMSMILNALLTSEGMSLKFDRFDPRDLGRPGSSYNIPT